MDVRRPQRVQLTIEIDMPTAPRFCHDTNQRTGDMTKGAPELASLSQAGHFDGPRLVFGNRRTPWIQTARNTPAQITKPCAY